jgi:hypothetical protein
MTRTRIVRAEVTYPAPAATKELKPGPLTFDVWVCPDRDTVLALFWCRRGGTWVLDMTPEAMKRDILDPRLHFAAPVIASGENPPGESASWYTPRSGISVLLPKGHKPMVAGYLMSLRGNVVVEASTVEFSWEDKQEKWLAWPLRKCAPDIFAIMRAIDAGLVGLGQREEPKRK